MMRRGRLAVLFVASACAPMPAAGPTPAAAPAAAPAPAPATTAPATARPAADSLLGSARIAALPAAERAAWTAYIAESRRRSELDRGSMRAELATVGRPRWTPAPEGPAVSVADSMTEAWFRSPVGRAMADALLTYQTPSGGWSKRVDLSKGTRQRGTSYSVSNGWDYIATFDNNATTGHLRFLQRAHAATTDARYRDAYLRGLDYVLTAQFPNGCWPQVYPLQGSYHDAATFNDDAITHILQLLRDIGRDRSGLVDDARKQSASAAFQRGIGCVVSSQVVVNGTPTVWGAQHDPLTLAPAKARAYEHVSLSGGESVDLMELLMGLPSPDARVVAAVHGAAAWFRATAINGYAYESKGELTARPGAGPIWARFYEIGSNRPIFSDRDGVIRYNWSELGTERRYGYNWYVDDAARALRRYDTWAVQHPAAR